MILGGRRGLTFRSHLSRHHRFRGAASRSTPGTCANQHDHCTARQRWVVLAAAGPNADDGSRARKRERRTESAPYAGTVTRKECAAVRDNAGDFLSTTNAFCCRIAHTARATLAVTGKLVRAAGKGLARVEETKTAAGRRTISLPKFAVETLAQRRGKPYLGEQMMIFPSTAGTWRDPDNFRAP
jgi:hypothetical protein